MLLLALGDGGASRVGGAAADVIKNPARQAEREKQLSFLALFIKPKTFSMTVARQKS